MNHIVIDRHILSGGVSKSTLAIHGDKLRVIGIFPHCSAIEPSGPNDCAKLLFYADQRLRLAEGLADGLRGLLADLSEHDTPIYYDCVRALERYDRLKHKLTEG